MVRPHTPPASASKLLPGRHIHIVCGGACTVPILKDTPAAAHQLTLLGYAQQTTQRALVPTDMGNRRTMSARREEEAQVTEPSSHHPLLEDWKGWSPLTRAGERDGEVLRALVSRSNAVAQLLALIPPIVLTRKRGMGFVGAAAHSGCQDGILTQPVHWHSKSCVCSFLLLRFVFFVFLTLCAHLVCVCVCMCIWLISNALLVASPHPSFPFVSVWMCIWVGIALHPVRDGDTGLCVVFFFLFCELNSSITCCIVVVLVSVCFSLLM